MSVSIEHFSLAGILTNRFIYGQKGLDARSRLVVWRALKKRGLSEQQLKDEMLSALPLRLGEMFLWSALLLTLIGGALFLWLASDPVREFVLQIHGWFDNAFDYVVLGVQWLAFYAVISLATWLVVCVAALWVYSSRTSRFI